MPEIAPFAAVRYDAARFGGDLSAVLAPPYDVLDEADKHALLARDSRNIVAVDLPHLPPKSAGPAEAYQRANRLLAEWLADGTLIRERQPAVYLYHQCFEHESRNLTRRMFIARARLQPFSHGSILPHEQTFGGPKEDRLALMKATRCNLSPIFGLYQDLTNEVGAALTPAASRLPDLHGTLDGVENRLWIVTDEAVIHRIQTILAERKVYIADGHHRYGTALLYRDFVASGEGGRLPDDHPANFVMFVFAGMDDPGCVILPYHRVLLNMDLATLTACWRVGTEPAALNQGDITLVDGRSGERGSLRFTDRAKLDGLEPAQAPAWRRLDVAYLHRYLLTGLLQPRLGGQEPNLVYVKSTAEALRIAREQAGVALLLNATQMEHLRAVSEAGGLMPQKSTYFHPKLATGLTINPLTRHENDVKGER